MRPFPVGGEPFEHDAGPGYTLSEFCTYLQTVCAESALPLQPTFGDTIMPARRSMIAPRWARMPRQHQFERYGSSN